MNQRQGFNYISTLAVITVTLMACNKEGTTGAGGGSNAPMNGSRTTSTGAGAGAPTHDAEARFAHLSPDAPPLDLCLRRTGDNSFQGPFIKETLKDAAGLTYGQVMRYSPLPEGEYTIRTVAAGKDTCDFALPGTTDVSIKLNARDRYTLAAVGLMTPVGRATEKFTIRALTDEPSAVTSTKAELIFINVSPDGTKFDLGTGTGADFKPIFSGVGFGDKGKVDGRYSLLTDPLANSTLVVRPSGSEAGVLSVPNVSVKAGETTTIFVVGDASGKPAPLAAMICAEREQPTAARIHCVIAPAAR